MEDRKSMGSALVDVFDAGVALVKSEVRGVAKQVGDVAKAKGIGVVLLLAAVGPLILALVLLILAVYFALTLVMASWLAALLMAVASLVVTGALVFMGIRRLGAEVQPDPQPRVRSTMSEDHDDHGSDRDPSSSNSAGTPASSRVSGSASGSAAAKATRPDTQGGKPAATTDAPTSAKWNAEHGRTADGQPIGVEMDRDSQNFAGGEARVVRERPGSATLRVEGGTTTLPVYESAPDGSPKMYGSGLNEKLDGQMTPTSGGRMPSNPEAGQDSGPGIPVSTDPTYREDMKRGNS